jgi:4-hydroxybenzoyl-CoA thioesterase
MFHNVRELTIEWGQCDPAGIVFNPRFFEIFDASTAFLFAAALGMHKRAMMTTYNMAGFPLVKTQADFKVPAAFGDRIRVDSTVAALRRTSFDVQHRIWKGDVLAVDGFETRVWVIRHPDDPTRIKSEPIPDEVAARLRANAEAPTPH